MPLLSSSTYRRPAALFNRHLETIYPALFRRVDFRQPTKERIETPDGDFLDLDWYRSGSSKLAILSHGLEGSSRRAYVVGMAKEAHAKGLDVLAWNYRSCGEELNRNVIFYHSGATYDLDTVVKHTLPFYQEIYLIGFSLGGNLTLKYLGEGRSLDPKIKKGVALSAPIDLGGSSDAISSGINWIYSQRFLTSLRKKITRKSLHFPEELSLEKYAAVRTLRDFDSAFTGPLHGFHDAEEYYRVNSSLQFLPSIQVPTLLLNAQNDPFLSHTCFPIEQAKKWQQIHAEFPKQGGHLGFSVAGKEKSFYSESRAVEFILSDG